MPKTLPKSDKQFLQRAAVILVADIVTISLSYLFALWARFEFNTNSIPGEYLQGLLRFLPVILLTTIIVYDVAKLYHSIWRYASISEISHIIVAYLVIGILLERPEFLLGLALDRLGLLLPRVT